MQLSRQQDGPSKKEVNCVGTFICFVCGEEATSYCSKCHNYVCDRDAGDSEHGSLYYGIVCENCRSIEAYNNAILSQRAREEAAERATGHICGLCGIRFGHLLRKCGTCGRRFCHQCGVSVKLFGRRTEDGEYGLSYHCTWVRCNYHPLHTRPRIRTIWDLFWFFLGCAVRETDPDYYVEYPDSREE
jgi:hypothetical protein